MSSHLYMLPIYHLWHVNNEWHHDTQTHTVLWLCLQYVTTATICNSFRGWGVKVGMVREWEAGKTVWSASYTRCITSRFWGVATWQSAIRIHVILLYFTVHHSAAMPSRLLMLPTYHVRHVNNEFHDTCWCFQYVTCNFPNSFHA